jgi:hypothetical protein
MSIEGGVRIIQDHACARGTANGGGLPPQRFGGEVTDGTACADLQGFVSGGGRDRNACGAVTLIEDAAADP